MGILIVFKNAENSPISETVLRCLKKLYISTDPKRYKHEGDRSLCAPFQFRFHPTNISCLSLENVGRVDPKHTSLPQYHWRRYYNITELVKKLKKDQGMALFSVSLDVALNLTEKGKCITWCTWFDADKMIHQCFYRIGS